MNTLIKNGLIINEGKRFYGDIFIKNDRIEQIGAQVSNVQGNFEEINAEGHVIIPGVIDDQVHFREPGLTHKAEIATESKAAVAGGVTSYMEMPNTKPQAVTIEELEKKYARASEVSPANYSFFMGATNDNIEEVLKVDKQKVCGVKVFMGSSTGNMLVDDRSTLEKIFSKCNHLIATHCESEEIIRKNTEKAQIQFGDEIPFNQHPIIRDEEACYASSSQAAELAQKYGTRLHILHISTAKELSLFRNDIPSPEKRITSEACVHHLWFDASQYDELGSKIKCNPAIKAPFNKEEILAAVLDDRIDVIATDHAPHTLAEKSQKYMKAPAGLPLIQHPLLMMLDFVDEGKISCEKVVEKMCHSVADIFNLNDRGYLREGYKADLVMIKEGQEHPVNKENLLYKCGWSPLEGHTFGNTIERTIVNGNTVFLEGNLIDAQPGERLSFN